MRLSAAIRLGAMLRPQAFGAYVTMDGKTCALGAGLEAVGALRVPDTTDGEDEEDWDEDVEQVWPWIADKQHQLRCPICGVRNEGVEPMGVIIHLNDRHRWSREQIADWVESIEPSGPDPDLIAEKTMENREVETCCV